jgi:alcohol dehydrogenase class IV
MNTVWKFAIGQGLVFGRGAVREVGSQLGRLGPRHVMIVTDRGLCGLGMAQRVQHSLEQAGISSVIFDGGQPEPPVQVAAQAHEFGAAARVDGVIGLGGGSNLDVAKMAAVLLSHGGAPSDYFNFDRIPGPILPLVAIPTTAGTGSEVSHSSVLTDTAAHVKVSALSPWLRPRLAIVDPSLSDLCPATVTAHSGIDALVHAIEAYTNRAFREMDPMDPQLRAYEGAHPLGDILAEQAIRLIGMHLRTAASMARKYVGQSMESIPAEELARLHSARDGMALAATLAGMAFSNCGVGLVHALEYPVGASVHCSHGEGNGLLLPHVMRFLRPARIERFARIGQWLQGQGASPTSLADPDSLPDPDSLKDPVAASWLAIREVESLVRDLGLRTSLQLLGVDQDQLDGFSEKSFAIKRLTALSPREVAREDLLEILRSAY